MIIRNRPDIKKNNFPFFIIIISLAIIVFVSQIFYRDPLFNYSLDLIKEINENESLQNFLKYVEGIANFLGSHGIFNVLILFVYNYANIYKTSMLIVSMSTSMLVGGMLKIIYRFPLMYLYDSSNKITPFSCSATWGVPSSQALSTTCVYLTLWKILFDNARLRYKSSIKMVCLFLFILIIILLDFIKFLCALHSIDQILFGMLIGLIIFLFLFYFYDIDLNDGKYLVKFVKVNFLYYLIANISTLIIVLLLYFILPETKDIIAYQMNFKKSKCLSEIPDSLLFSNEALLLCIPVFANLGIILGMKMELKFIFKDNDINWRQYNFSKEKTDEESLLSKLSISKESQWNHTTFFFSLLRLLAVFIIHFIILTPYFFIKFKSPFIVVLIFKLFLPVFILNFSMFYIEKLILSKLGLTNDAILKIINENI